MSRRGLRLGLAVFLLAAVPVLADFEVVPDTVGIGLQKNFDVVDFISSDDENCVLYHLGNPWAADVTGWLVIEGELEEFFTGNEPEEVFVPSGTFRYNSSCCLIPIYACFDFPYVLDTETFSGKVFSGFNTGSERRTGVTGSQTGSSVAYTLTVNVHPADMIVLNAGEKKCIDFYGFGEHCFSAPLVVLSDTAAEEIVGGHTVELLYKNNLKVLIGALALVAAFFIYRYRKELKKHVGKSK